jgi:predicted molibdopterin-dependent oxidoreductase YjgC
VVFLAFHWREAPANLLTQDFALDPRAKIPEYKVTAVRLERLPSVVDDTAPSPG